MTKRLLILGAGGFGREVLDWARQSPAHGSEWVVAGFLDDNPDALAAFPSVDVPVLGSIADHRPAADEVFVGAIGQVGAKRRCVEAILARGGQFVPALVHPSAVVGSRARLGRGAILCPHAVVSSEAVLGDFVSINLHSTVAHDARVGEFTQVHCHCDLTGGVLVGRDVTVGSRASILPGVKVGDGATVGAGSVVMRDVPAGATVFGAPARMLVPGKERIHG